MASRAGESILRAAGLGDLVAADAEAFVAAAVKFAADPASLRAVAARLRDARASAPLFDTEGRVRALFDAFQEIHDRAVRGEPPGTFKLRR
jgi:predicted O-linked N-acetylglucosamine transferase (SPINDLY family)